MSGLARRGFLKSLLAVPAALPAVAKAAEPPVTYLHHGGMPAVQTSGYAELASSLKIDQSMGVVLPSNLYCYSTAMVGPGIWIKSL